MTNHRSPDRFARSQRAFALAAQFGRGDGLTRAAQAVSRAGFIGLESLVIGREFLGRL